MRLVATEYITLDGIFEEPGEWSFQFFSDQASQFKWRELRCQRRAPARPQDLRGIRGRLADDGGHGRIRREDEQHAQVRRFLNPRGRGWTGSIIVTGNLVTEIGKLRDQPGQDLLLSGSGQLLNGLKRANLIDLYRFMVHPIVLGRGIAAIRRRHRPDRPQADAPRDIRLRHRHPRVPAREGAMTRGPQRRNRAEQSPPGVARLHANYCCLPSGEPADANLTGRIDSPRAEGPPSLANEHRPDDLACDLDGDVAQSTTSATDALGQPPSCSAGEPIIRSRSHEA